MASSLGGMHSVQADISLRAILCSNGHIIATGSGHAAKVHVSAETAGDQALAATAQKTGDTLIKKIIEDWNKQVNNGTSLVLTVKGVKTFKQKGAILAAVKAMSGVASVNERNWDGTSQVLVADVSYKGNPQGFCEKADGRAVAEGVTLAVAGQNGSDISMQIEVK